MAYGTLIRQISERQYVTLQDRIYTAKRLPRSPHDWAVFDDEEQFLFLVHYRRERWGRYYLHGSRSYSKSLGDAILRGLSGG